MYDVQLDGVRDEERVVEGVAGVGMGEEGSGLRRTFTIQTIEVPMATQTVMNERKLVTRDAEEEGAVETSVPVA